MLRSIKPHVKHILTISWPIIVGQLGMILTGFFDNWMVSKLGYDQLAAAGISNSVYFLIAVFPMGITMAFATVLSIFRGKNEEHKGPGIFRDALIVTVVISLVTLLLILNAVHFFEIFNQETKVETLARPYLRLLAYSSVPMLFFFFVKNISDGYQYTRAGMYVTLVSLILNVFFNWIFIFGKLGSDAYGLNGAGYATILARSFSFLAMLFLLFRKKGINLDLSSVLHAFRNRKHKYFRTILRLGIPTGFQYFFEVAAFALAAIMAGWLGSKPLAAHNMAITIAALTYMFASGISAGASITVAQAAGKNNFLRVRILGRSSLIMTTAVMMVFAVIFYVFNVFISKQFSVDPEVISIGASLLTLAAIFQLSDGVQAVSVGLLRGIEDVNMPSFITFLAYWVVAMPLGYYLGFNKEMGAKGIWIGLTLGLSFSALLLCTRFYLLLKRKQT